MNDSERKKMIEKALQAFGRLPLFEAACNLFTELGYSSERRFRLTPGTPENFLKTFAPDKDLSRPGAIRAEWRAIEFLFQITTDEVQDVSQGAFIFTGRRQFDPHAYDSYLFVAMELAGEHYTRTQLAALTREINRLFPQPVMLLIRYGKFISLAIIHRRPGLREPSRDVLEKVTLIKDVGWTDPVRAHVDIFSEFRLDALQKDFPFQDFAGLHKAWEGRLATYQVNEGFYRDIANWYFWALQRQDVVYPPDIREVDAATEEGRELRSIFLIRMLTRLIFCWFIKEKGLIPPELFRTHDIERILGKIKPEADNFYRAILQNLFFATLNVPVDERKFIGKSFKGRNKDYANQYVFRYEDEFADLESFNALLNQVPFLNGGLFECLDKKTTPENPQPERRLDGFSTKRPKQTQIPNELFFSEKKFVDLTEFYRDKKTEPRWAKSVEVFGLITTLSRYKFTVVENTPFEEEIALDPELLGKVFENLLASYNEDTRTTARKATGSFYTPREIVSYMVDESLLSYFEAILSLKSATVGESLAPFRDKLHSLLAADPAAYHVDDYFSESEIVRLIGAIDRVKILDPACGSGAFPMGALHRLVDLLAKLDPNNRRWKEQQLARAQADRQLAEQMQDEKNKESTLANIAERERDIERSFSQQFHELDYARKLYLIENGVFGVDIQPIACQIAKLRFFISLIVDQKTDSADKNLGIRPLPNLETKIVAADFTIPIEVRLSQGTLFDFNPLDVRKLDELKEDLARIRHEHFNARNPKRKEKCQRDDLKCRRQMADLLKNTGVKALQAEQMVAWDPYDQNAHATFFDADWMFNFKRERRRERIATLRGNFKFVNQLRGQTELIEAPKEDSGFDIVIGNPPYIRLQTLKQKNPELVEFYKKEYLSATKGNYDIYVVFVEAGVRLLQPAGNLSFILPHLFFTAKYGEPLRSLISSGKHISEIVHFGHRQVFPGATNYVCLLFLKKTATPRFRYIKGDNLEEWLSTKAGPSAVFQSEKVGSKEWNIAVGKDGELFDKLDASKVRLGHIATMFVGLQTSADTVFLFKNSVSGSGDITIVESEELGNPVKIETEMLKPVVRSGDIGRFDARATALILFPYHVEGGKAILYSEKEMSRNFPHAWNYLNANRRLLENREHGKFSDSGWYQLYPKNLEFWEQPKLMLPYMISELGAYFDEAGWYFVNVTTGGFGITISDDSYQPKFVTGLLNTKVEDWFLQKVSRNFRGGYFAANKQYLVQLPIPPVSAAQQAVISILVDYLQYLKRRPQVAIGAGIGKTVNVSFLEQILNGLAYELFFPNELHSSGLRIFDALARVQMQELDLIPELERHIKLHAFVENLNNTKHPLYAALYTLRGLDVVRTIEGEP